MNKEILGRTLEKKRLTETLYSHRSELVAVYGRRRIGKTYLIREFFNEKIIFSFIGLSDESKTKQIRN
jgi:AAA+ ATPase superfamily predicted ATPase